MIRRAAYREAQAFFSAVQFLTRLPTPAWTGWEAGRLDRATPHFVLVGGLIGAACGAVHLMASVLLVPPLAAILAIGTGIVLTGALHEDGLADFADGLGARDSGRALAIMKDSHVGAFGVVALVLVLGAKVAALSAMPPALAAAALVAAHGLSRAWLYPTVKALDYARDPADAKVAPISRTVHRGEWLRTILFAALTLAPLLALSRAADPHRLAALGLAIALSALTAALLARTMRRRLGGWTGDTLGAQQQLTETAFLIGASAWIST